jgi:cytochrome c biogenesis protein CcdA
MDVSIPLVIGAALVDGINPCAFAVLILLIVYLINFTKSKKYMLLAGLVYILAVYLTYFIAGLGLLTVIHATGFSYHVYIIAAVIAIGAGIVSIYDSLKKRKDFLLKIPEKRVPLIKRWAEKASLPAAFVLGVLVSMFELPCTGAIYLAILAMLSSASRTVAIGYLLLYNLIFILPLLIILGAAFYGVTAEKLSKWRGENRYWMKLALGIVLIGLGIWMLFLI